MAVTHLFILGHYVLDIAGCLAIMGSSRTLSIVCSVANPDVDVGSL